MKKVFTFRQSVMNGTVTMSTAVSAFATRELAEETQRALIEANRKDDMPGLYSVFSHIEETNVYETRDEIPLFKPKTREELERERLDCIVTMQQIQAAIEHVALHTSAYYDTLRLRDRAERRIKEIDEELKRMEDGV